MKKSTTKIFAALIALLIFAAYFSFVSIQTAKADDTTATEYGIETVDITNGQFEESESDYPATATGWTGEYFNESTGGLTGGVIDLNPSTFTSDTLRDDYKLSEYKEYQNDIPRSPFGRGSSNPDTNSKVLMLNAENANVAYAYKSNTISLSKNGYYKISVWAKTSENANACIKLAQPDSGGLKNAVAFHNVNTFNYHGEDYKTVNNSEKLNFGWVEYSFYIETSTLSDTSVIVSLQLGDYTKWTDKDGNVQQSAYTSNGYVFYDNITVYQYSPDVFADLITDFDKDSGRSNNIKSDEYRHFYTEKGVAEETKMYYSECDAVDLSIKDGQILGLSSETASTDPEYIANNIGSFSSNTDRWEAAEGTSSSNIISYGIRNNVDETAGILYKKDIPFSPNGANNDILLMSSYISKHDSFESMAYGLASPEFSITRHKFYKVSVWVKSINEDSANVVIRGENYKGLSLDDKKNQLYYSSGLKGLSDGTASRNGWTEVSFFLEGSSFAEYKISIELWLGIGAGTDNDGNAVEQQNVKGVAMFDSLRIEELTRTEFTNYSGSGTSVTFDAATDSSGGFSNGDFDKVGDYNDYAYPLAPQSWTYLEANENSVNGMSKDTVKGNEDKGVFDQGYWDASVIRGIFPTDDVHFNANKSNYGALYSNPGSADSNNTYANGNNALLITSNSKVAVGYSSSTVSVTAGVATRIDINMSVQGMTGYGANLVLKKGEHIISTIEKIGIENVGLSAGYNTYSFYIEGGESDIGDVSVEIWLGLYDRYNNTSKLASGTIVVDSVSLTASEEGDTSAYTSKYADELSGRNDGSFGVYSFKSDNFSSFDKYETGLMKSSYDYGVTSSASEDAVDFGVFDSSDITSGNSYLWNGYKNSNAAGYKYKLYLGNNLSSYSRVTGNFRKTVSGNAYYKLTFTIKVNIPTGQAASNVEYQGAYIGITSGDTDYVISNIKNTAKIDDVLNPESGDYEYFRDYTFYIKGEESDDDSDDFNIIFGIGGQGENQHSRGKLVIANISYAISSDVEYSDTKALIENPGTKESRTCKTISFASASDEDDDDTDTDTSSSVNNLSAGQSWLVISGVIIAIVLIVAVVAFAVRYLARKRRVTAGGKAKDGASYDRKSTLVKQHNKRAGASDSVAYASDLYESYDEDIEDQIRKDKLEEAEEELESEATEESTTVIAEEVPVTESDEEIISEETSAAAGEESPAEAVETDEIPAEGAVDVADTDTDNAVAEEIDYNEVVEFKAPEYVKPAKKTETLEEAIQKAKVQKEKYEDDEPVKRNTWDEFDD